MKTLIVALWSGLGGFVFSFCAAAFVFGANEVMIDATHGENMRMLIICVTLFSSVMGGVMHYLRIER